MKFPAAAGPATLVPVARGGSDSLRLGLGFGVPDDSAAWDGLSSEITAEGAWGFREAVFGLSTDGMTEGLEGASGFAATSEDGGGGGGGGLPEHPAQINARTAAKIALRFICVPGGIAVD